MPRIIFVLVADDVLGAVTPINLSQWPLRRRHINKHLEHDSSNHWKLSFTIMQIRLRQGCHYVFKDEPL